MKNNIISILVTVLTAVCFTGCTPDGDDEVFAIACIQSTNQPVPVNTPIEFTSCSTNANQLIWNMGDGSNNMTAPIVSHAYANPGNYVVTLTASNGTHTDSETKTIQVIP